MKFEKMGVIECGEFEEMVKLVSAFDVVAGRLEAVEQVVCVGACTEHDKPFRVMRLGKFTDELVRAKVFAAERIAHTVIAHLRCLAIGSHIKAQSLRVFLVRQHHESRVILSPRTDDDQCMDQ